MYVHSSKPKLVDLPLSRIGVAAYLCFVIFCFLFFQIPDLHHTVASSYAYIEGHYRDFYDYNVATVKRNDYLPLIYVIYAIWMLPLHWLGLTTDVTLHSYLDLSSIEIMWAKFLLLLAFAFVARGIYACGMLLSTNNRRQARFASLVFLTSPIAVFAVFVLGQYDVFALCFAVWGFYFYLKGDLLKFAVLFSFAISFKYFALLPFIPLVLLREKRFFLIAKLFIVGAIATGVQFALYWSNEAFRHSILYLASAKLSERGSESPTQFQLLKSPLLYLAIGSFILWVLAYRKNIRSISESKAWMFNVPIAAYALLLTAVGWHPQWFIITMPFFALATIFAPNRKILFIGEMFAIAALAWVSTKLFPGIIDGAMLQNGVFKSHFADQCMQMKQMLPGYLILPMRIWIQLFLFLPLILSAYAKVRKIQVNPANMEESWAWMQTRLYLGLLAFIIPAFICALKINC